MGEPMGILSEHFIPKTARERAWQRKPRTRTIAVFPSGGSVQVYNVGKYNPSDYNDLVDIAMIRAERDGARVQILPAIDSIEDPNYARLFPELLGTEYERKCPDFRIITQEDNGRTLVEYETYKKDEPFEVGKVTRMIKKGSEQARNIIIDTRGTSMTVRGVRRRIEKLLQQKSFNRVIDSVWMYDGENVTMAYKRKVEG